MRSLMDRFAKAVETSYDRDRRTNPYRFINSPHGLGPNFLFVENVAAILGCSIDFVRRTPRRDLPASKIGQRLIYARADVEAYIRAHRRDGTERHIAPQAQQELQRVAPRRARNPDIAVFDPVKYVRQRERKSS